MSLYREQGVVLRTYRLGEADRIVVLMSESRGKVRAVVKGVRKTKSRFGARLEPLSHVALMLYEGRNLDTVTQAEVLDHFRSVREDLDRFSKAQSVLEAVDSIAQEGQGNPRLYQMLVGALRSLAAADSPLLVGAFFWKLLALEGYRPLLDRCASCGAQDLEALAGFDPEMGGAICRTCRRGPTVVGVNAASLALMRRVFGGGLADALREPASAAVREVTGLATTALEHHLERRMKSVSVGGAVSRT
ncbi:MAG TPA: DNA repair protein RecO [Acidimicrobiales bacterium]|nr:DNA repair protein RecO [Acidimicrobiales bacterium]